MAPLAFGDKINLYSMIGTWLGTLFTLIGLAAVIVQLRALLKDFSNSRDELVKAAAGNWAICLPKLRRSETGIIEGKAPSLRAWIHYYYNEDKSIVVCPYERKSMSGQSSWSQLFSRLQILPEDLMNPGHWDSLNERRGCPPQVPIHGDILIEGSKISYGFPGDEFAALLILSGFSPSAFHPKETTRTSGHLGFMYVAAHKDPFSQIAQLDGTFWNTFNTFHGFKWDGRCADRLNVRHCLDLALGILRFSFAGKPATFLFCTDDMEPIPFHGDQHPWPRPSSQQVLVIRRNLTASTGGSVAQNPLYDITSMAFPDFHLMSGYTDILWKELSLYKNLTVFQMNSVLEVAFGLNALKPWGLLSAIPQSVVQAFCPHIDKLLAKRTQVTPSSLKLIEMFRGLPPNSPFNVPHRTREAMNSALESLSDVETRSFFGLSTRCSLYYDAMIYVFENHNLKLEDVQIRLAACCATNYAVEILNSPTKHMIQVLKTRTEELQWRLQFRANVRECLKGSPMNEVEPWACEILAVYLRAWLHEAKEVKGDFPGNFRRRVFLG